MEYNRWAKYIVIHPNTINTNTHHHDATEIFTRHKYHGEHIIQKMNEMKITNVVWRIVFKIYPQSNCNMRKRLHIVQI